MERPSMFRTILGGFVATVVVTAFLYLFATIGSVPMGFFSLIGRSMGMSDPTMAKYIWWWGLIWHFNFGAIIFPQIYFFAIYPVLPGKAWAKGSAWGAILWLFAMVVGMPLMGYGLFAWRAVAPVSVVVGLFALHIIYGLTFGLVSGEAVSEKQSIVIEREAA